jgi:G:T-mismatch repair DNA endonuclease (very short patch repair protein)
VPDSLRTQPFLGSTAVRSGLVTHRRLRGSTWRRLFHDVYVHREVVVTHELRVRGAALLLPRAVVSGCSAAVLWGVALAGADEDVEVTLPPGSHMVRLAGIHARRAALGKGDVLRRLDVPVTTPEATAVRLASVLNHDRAVAAVDQLIATGFVGLAAVRARAAAARGPGSARARAVCAWADGLAESPQETKVRLLLHRSGLPRPVAQFRIMDDAGFVARADFAWPEHKVALEYDGLWHAESRQFAKDRRRLNRLQSAGWRVVFVTAADLHDPVALVARVAAALGLVSAR